MKRLFIVISLISFTFCFDRWFSTSLPVLNIGWLSSKQMTELSFLIFGVLVVGFYTIYSGSRYYHEEEEEAFILRRAVPGAIANIFKKMALMAYAPIENTWLGRYLRDIYAEPIRSEHALGKFFFGKTLLTTALAFYETDPLVLFAILSFSAAFDSLTGFYQQSLMNFFHKSIFNNKILKFCQNLFKRYLLDVFRAEIIFFILMGLEFMTFSEQFHIFRNRFVSASYYFSAVIIDSLVASGVISRKLRARVVIFASTFGGMLCLLDFAKTKFPSWVPQEQLAQIPSWVPGPLAMLMYFNVLIFTVFGSVYIIHKYQSSLESSDSMEPAFD